MSLWLNTWSVSGTVKFKTWPFSFHSVLSCMLGTWTLTATGPWREKKNVSKKKNTGPKSTYIAQMVVSLMEKRHVSPPHNWQKQDISLLRKTKTLFLRRNSSSEIRLSSVFIFLVTGSSSWGGGGWDGGAGAELGGCGTGGAGTNAERRIRHLIYHGTSQQSVADLVHELYTQFA